MGISLSLILTAIGAVLIWAVSATVSGVNIHTVGVILLIIGIVGFVSSLVFWSSWGGFTRSRADVGAAGPTTVERTTVVR